MATPMGRPRTKKKTKNVFMRVDYDIYKRSKPFIHENRTKDYEDYLMRKIYTNNRAEMIKLEIEELDIKREQLMKEYDREVGILESENHMEDEEINKLTFALNTVMKTINNVGTIGLDRIEQIADMQDVNPSELKYMIPENMKDKITDHHQEIVMGRSKYDELL